MTSNDIFTNSIVLPSIECHVVELIQYGVFTDGLFSLGKMHLLPVFSSLGSPFLLSTERYSILWMYLSIHLLKDLLDASKFCQFWIKLPSYQEWMGVPVALHFCQHLVLLVFWILAILILYLEYYYFLWNLKKWLYKTVLGNSLRTFDNTQFKCH